MKYLTVDEKISQKVYEYKGLPCFYISDIHIFKQGETVEVIEGFELYALDLSHCEAIKRRIEQRAIEQNNMTLGDKSFGLIFDSDQTTTISDYAKLKVSRWKFPSLSRSAGNLRPNIIPKSMYIESIKQGLSPILFDASTQGKPTKIELKHKKNSFSHLVQNAIYALLCVSYCIYTALNASDLSTFSLIARLLAGFAGFLFFTLMAITAFSDHHKIKQYLGDIDE